MLETPATQITIVLDRSGSMNTIRDNAAFGGGVRSGDIAFRVTRSSMRSRSIWNCVPGRKLSGRGNIFP